MKQTYYLIRSASDRMGGQDSFTSMTEKELFKESNKGLLDCAYTTIYKQMDKKDLSKEQKRIKKAPLELKQEKLEVAQHALAMSHRAYRFSGPVKGVREEREKLEKEIDLLKAEIKILSK